MEDSRRPLCQHRHIRRLSRTVSHHERGESVVAFKMGRRLGKRVGRRIGVSIRPEKQDCFSTWLQ